ncbi:hypothetical protein NDU88_002956 [Pleurodeles waltl]|uniref:Uncharacterized protein n=1 Tax=Pleurodeles waltl TaxID=8319 RepID=A0AAV7VFW7_PLEWA|nr:hypothetical protein NDU88_002956 [Pleurodeles waltl]
MDINTLRDDQCKMSDKIKANEKAISTLVPEQTEHASQLDAKRLRPDRVHDRTDDAEGRVRRNTVQILGVPESVEGRNPTKYFEDWLCTVVAPPKLSEIIVVESVSRVPSKRPIPTAPPKTMVARFLNF